MAMTRGHVKELLPVLQAFAEGKAIQFMRQPNDVWVDLLGTSVSFEATAGLYRIKPVPEYRPFMYEEFLADYEKRYSRRLVKFAADGNKISHFTIATVRWDGVKLSNDTWPNWQELLDTFVWQDGTPIGVRTDE